MELESLKNMLNESISSGNSISGDDLRVLLRKKSKSAISKMKRNLFAELILMILLYAYVSFRFVNEMKELVWMLWADEIIYLFYFFTKYRLLKKLECLSCEIRSNLSRQLKTLESLLRFYLWSGLLLIPMAAVGSFWIGYTYASPAETSQNHSFLLITSFVILVVSLLLCIPLYFFTKWYIRKLYGRHVEKLKELMNELNEEAQNPKM